MSSTCQLDCCIGQSQLYVLRLTASGGDNEEGLLVSYQCLLAYLCLFLFSAFLQGPISGSNPALALGALIIRTDEEHYAKHLFGGDIAFRASACAAQWLALSGAHRINFPKAYLGIGILSFVPGHLNKIAHLFGLSRVLLVLLGAGWGCGVRTA